MSSFFVQEMLSKRTSARLSGKRSYILYTIRPTSSLLPAREARRSPEPQRHHLNTRTSNPGCALFLPRCVQHQTFPRRRSMSTSTSSEKNEMERRTLTENVTYATPDPARQSQIQSSLPGLLSQQQLGGRRWQLTADGKAIERKIRFRTFKQATGFMVDMFPRIAEARHHPTLTNTYNAVSLRWTTHRDRESGMAGVSELDVQMAKTSDEVAAAYGEMAD